ncbi:MAG: tRNA(Ile)-lysidine synthase [Chloroflexia bacterium]|jgi:tRNA(Ile)-lysidine synthase|nr:tRNA(Ile)-lysidine synthase [Chloroflexia bacterium]
MSLLAESVARDARQAGLFDLLTEAPLVVAVSGGADSLALLSILRELRGTHAQDTLHVAHLDHGFRGEESEADAHFVEELAGEWGLTCTITRFDVPAYAASRKLSAEDAARRLRYAFLAGVAEEHGGTVAVAHHADDQAETVLMHLLRGTGISGLAGMRMLSDLPVDVEDPSLRQLRGTETTSTARLFRPLLGTWRVDIEAYCKEIGLSPRHDATNRDPAYRRNYVRHIVLPALEAVSPQVKRNLFRLANIAAADDDVLESLAHQEWDRLVVQVESDARTTISSEALASLPLGVARRVVIRVLRTVAGKVEDIDFRQVESALQVLSGAPEGPRAIDVAGGLRVKRAGRLGVVEQQLKEDTRDAEGNVTNRPLMSAESTLLLEVGSTTTLPNGWRVVVRALERDVVAGSPGDYLALFDLDALPPGVQLVLRTWMPGDSIRPLGLHGRKKLQDVLVDAKIPREVRAYLPVVALQTAGDEVLWLPGPGGRRSAIAPITEQTRHLLSIEFNPPTMAGQEAESSV